MARSGRTRKASPRCRIESRHTYETTLGLIIARTLLPNSAVEPPVAMLPCPPECVQIPARSRSCSRRRPCGRHRSGRHAHRQSEPDLQRLHLQRRTSTRTVTARCPMASSYLPPMTPAGTGLCMRAGGHSISTTSQRGASWARAERHPGVTTSLPRSHAVSTLAPRLYGLQEGESTQAACLGGYPRCRHGAGEPRGQKGVDPF